MLIDKNTKISKILKANSKAVEVIAGINKHFKKLNNPVLRNVLAPRVTVADAAKIGHIRVIDFLKRLEKIGFEIEWKEKPETQEEIKKSLPVTGKQVVTLDVRSIIESGADPFKDIMCKLKEVSKGEVLKVINVFEPLPLIKIMREKGYKVWSEKIAEEEYHTYFENASGVSNEENVSDLAFEPGSFDDKLASFGSNIREIDVRLLEMPEPMVTILKEIETLPENYALLVNHKKVPQFLLPELKSRNYTWMHKDMQSGFTLLLIYKTDL